ncbi:MAG: hypothetical protein HOO67_00965 [Candidatus Peribacteraceae bacterium]|nr:hypothetical protein [Candidatus Peribacteraceae bacterium]
MPANQPPDHPDEEPLRPDDPAVRDEIAMLLGLPPSELDRLEDVWQIYRALLQDNPTTDPEDTYGLIQASFVRADLKMNRGLMDWV